MVALLEVVSTFRSSFLPGRSPRGWSCVLWLFLALDRSPLKGAADPTLPALDPTIPIHHYVHDVWTTDDGLPTNTIRDIVQTADGYLWLATHAGLVRFDGARFKTFDTRNSAPLNSNYLTQLCLARDGTLWIGSSAGLIRYRDGKFSTLTKADGLTGAVVQDLLEDQDGVLWVIAGGAAHRLEGDRLSKVERPATVEEGEITSVVESTDGTMWFTTPNDGVVEKRKNEWRRLAAADGAPTQQISFAYLDRSDALWITGTTPSPIWLASFGDGEGF